MGFKTGTARLDKGGADLGIRKLIFRSRSQKF